MKDQVDSFIVQIPNLNEQQASSLIDYFAYFLIVIAGKSAATPSGIDYCFELARIQKYSNTSAYLSKNAKRSRKTTTKFIKIDGGYQLERSFELLLQKALHTGPQRLETSHLLRGLLPKVVDQHKRTFLQEAIDCYEIGARRGAIALTWSLVVHHLFEYILSKKLNEFNIALAKNTDKRIKVTQVTVVDDFSEIPENKFIEFLRSAQIISNDVRKILDTKLGIRNSAAHPSAVMISEVKATDFIIDLVDNVVLKYIP
ncbi:MAG: hypothetical protein Q7U13_11610 [Rhodoferax sp.]|nr:hypothetical protein [Rhodoferax sp.]